MLFYKDICIYKVIKTFPEGYNKNRKRSKDSSFDKQLES